MKPDTKYPNRMILDESESGVPVIHNERGCLINGLYHDTNHPNMKTPSATLPLTGKFIWLTVTPQCSLHCDYCQMIDLVKNPGVMFEAPTEKFTNWIERMGNKFNNLGISGGEPLMPSVYPKTHAIIQKALDTGYNRISIHTNGQHILPEDFNFTSNKCEISFIVSIDGVKEDNDFYRGAGTYDKAIAFLRDIKERGYWFSTYTVLHTKPDYTKLQEYFDFIKSEKLCAGLSPSVTLVRPIGGAKDNKLMFEMTPNEQKALAKWCKKRHITYLMLEQCNSTGSPDRPIYISPAGKYIPCERLVDNLKSDYGDIADVTCNPTLARKSISAYNGGSCYGLDHEAAKNLKTVVVADYAITDCCEETFLNL